MDGSGNTKTQDYIVAAIKKMEELEAKIDGGGGGNSGVTTFYCSFPVSYGSAFDTELYKDTAMTETVTGSDFYNAMDKGALRLCCLASASGDSHNDIVLFTRFAQPMSDTSAAYDEYPPEAYFYTGSKLATLIFASTTPSDTLFNYYVPS